MTLAAGTRLGPYEILSPLGTGGMGEVYRALDGALQRDVALKILHHTVASDPERLARLKREAQVLASLNHPHIGAIYGFETSTTVHALVLELVAGPTLADRIAQGPIPIHEALSIARQIAEALEAAHEQGIIHRDLKPGNIKIRPDGAVKVLDFGLAKLAPTRESVTMTATQAGAIIGTPAYMSPEQATGEQAGPRADIWSFGVVLYEMLVGRSPFGRRTVTETLASVLTTQPDYSLLPTETPATVRQLVRRCLEKDRKRRLQHMGEARIDLEDALAAETLHTQSDAALTHAAPSVVAALPGATSSRRRERAVWIAFMLLTLAVAATTATWGLRAGAPPPETHVEIVTPPSRNPASLAISPDGRRIIFEGIGDDGSRLWLRSLDSATARPLAGTENGSLPFWSPDNRSVGFFADSQLKRINLETGSVQLLAPVTLSPLGGTWNRDGTILFTPNLQGGVFRVRDTGGEATLVSSGGAPQVLPDGVRFLSVVMTEPKVPQGVYVSGMDGSESTRVLPGNMNRALVTSSGQMLFLRQSTLYAQPFDTARLQLTGSPVMVAERVERSPDGLFGAISTSETGTIVYRSGLVSSNQQRQLIWFDRSGGELERVGDTGFVSPALSSDGRFVALNRTVDANQDVYLLNTRTGVLDRFTAGPEGEQSPVWSPDGQRIVFSITRKGVVDLYAKPVAAGGSAEPLLETSANKVASDWSADGRYLLYRSNERQTSFDIWALPMGGNKQPIPVLRTEFGERDAQFSFDAKWIAYQSNRSGRSEIYVYPFPGPGREQQVSTGGGAQVRWRRDGRELFYVALDGRLMAVPVDRPSADTIETGAPVPLFHTRLGNVVESALTQQYVVAADGKRFLVSTLRQAPTSSINVILNWRPPTN